MNIAPKEIEWYKIADSVAALSFNENSLLEISISDKRICLSFHKEKLHAFSASCPHAGGRLSCGYIDAMDNIVCPVHHYRFQLQNGRNSSGEGYFLKIYPLQTRDDGLYIGLEKNNPHMESK